MGDRLKCISPGRVLEMTPRLPTEVAALLFALGAVALAGLGCANPEPRPHTISQPLFRTTYGQSINELSVSRSSDGRIHVAWLLWTPADHQFLYLCSDSTGMHWTRGRRIASNVVGKPILVACGNTIHAISASKTRHRGISRLRRWALYPDGSWQERAALPLDPTDDAIDMAAATRTDTAYVAVLVRVGARKDGAPSGKPTHYSVRFYQLIGPDSIAWEEIGSLPARAGPKPSIDLVDQGDKWAIVVATNREGADGDVYDGLWLFQHSLGDHAWSQYDLLSSQSHAASELPQQTRKLGIGAIDAIAVAMHNQSLLIAASSRGNVFLIEHNVLKTTTQVVTSTGPGLQPYSSSLIAPVFDDRTSPTMLAWIDSRGDLLRKWPWERMEAMPLKAKANAAIRYVVLGPNGAGTSVGIGNQVRSEGVSRGKAPRFVQLVRAGSGTAALWVGREGEWLRPMQASGNERRTDAIHFSLLSGLGE